MDACTTLTGLLASRRSSEAGITFAEPSGERFVTYGELERRATELLGPLVRHGLRPGRHAVLQTESNERFALLFWACLLGGAVPVPLAAARTDEQKRKLAAVRAQLPDPLVLADAELADAAGNQAGVVPYPALEALLERAEPAVLADEPPIRLHAADPDEPAFIQFTSGSTGDPKGVVLTHANLLANMRAIVRGARSGPIDSSLSWLPLTHDMGLIGFHLSPLLAGMNQWLMPTSQFVLRPMSWLELASREHITCLASPNFGLLHLMQHFKPDQAGSWDLSAVRLLFNGAEPISAEACRAFLELLNPFGLRPQSLFPVYGLAEACLAVTFPDPDEPLRTVHVRRGRLRPGEAVPLAEAGDLQAMELVELGTPVAGCEAALFDGAGKRLGESEAGLVCIRGANVTRGYFNRPDANRELIRDGWLNTGDIGFFHEGRLYLTGRMKDILFVNGQNYYPHDLEELLAELPACAAGKAAVSAVSDPRTGSDIAAVFVQHRGKPEAFLAIRRQVRVLLSRRAGLEAGPVVPVKRIPKTTSGKIKRFELADELLAGQFAAALELLDAAEAAAAAQEALLAPEADKTSLNEGAAAAGPLSPTEEAASSTGRLADSRNVRSAVSVPKDEAGAAGGPTAIESRLLDIWMEILGTERLGPNDSFLEHGGNSLRAARAAARIQEELEAPLSLAELLRHDTARALAAYVEQRLAEGVRTAPASAPLVRADRGSYPATPAQRRLHLHEELYPGTLSYRLPYEVGIEGPLDMARLAAVWEALAERHDALRTSFRLVEGELVAEIATRVELPLAMTDLRALAPDEAAAAAASRRRSFLRPMDLERAPLLRLELLQLPGGRHALMLDAHHLVTDGSSMGVLMHDLAALYDGRPLPEPSPGVGDIALQELDAAVSGATRSAERYWKAQFADGIPSAPLPADRPRPLLPTFRGGVERLQLDRELSERLAQLGRSAGTTLYAALLAVYGLLLERYAGADDVVVGTAYARRVRRETLGTVGLLATLLPLRLRGSRQRTVLEWVREVGETSAAAIEHGDIGYEAIAELAGASREAGRSALFDTAFTLQNLELPQFRTDELRLTPDAIPTGSCKFDLFWECEAHPDGVAIRLEYADDLFGPETARQLLRHYETLARQAAAAPERAAASLETLIGDEREQTLRSGVSRWPEQEAAPLQELIRRQAEEGPDRIALSFAGGSWSYGELWDASGRLAAGLAELGAARGSRIAIAMKRSPLQLAALIAALRLGGAYVPIDPNYPAERAAFMLRDAEVDAAVADASALDLLEQAAAACGRPVKRLDAEAWMRERGAAAEARAEAFDGTGAASTAHAAAEDQAERRDSLSSPDDLAYILYTSGSTGTPKGIRTTHRNVARVVYRPGYVELGPDDALLQLSSLAFDGSTFDIYGALTNGARLVLADGDEAMDAPALVRRLREDGVTVLFATTALFNTLAAYGLDGLPRLRRVLFGGERASVPHARLALASLGPGSLLHVYGPTETTVFATAWPVAELEPGASALPIGRPIDGTETMVLDASGRLVPDLVPGELHVAGSGVAEGYVGLPRETEERFRPHPYRPGARMYRTGDRVRRLHDGSLVFLDRLDQQVKLRGFRIELGEIEARALASGQVREAHAGVVGEGAEAALCAYVVPSAAGLDEAALRSWLAQGLPAFMQPAFIVSLERLPLGPTGKVDRRALPAPEAAASAARERPATETERELAGLWQKVLKRPELGVTDSFFELGGHSLTAAALTGEIHRRFGVPMPVREVFARPTVRGQASWLDQAERAGRERLRPAPPAESYPLSPAQARLALLERQEGIGLAYHVPLALRLGGAPSAEAVQAALQALVDRHEPLRTTVRLSGAEPRAVVAPAAKVELGRMDIAGPAGLAEAMSAFLRPLPLDRAPLLAACYVETEAEDERYLLLNLHHIAADGISVGLLLEELVRLLEGAAPEPIPDVQHKDYAIWLEAGGAEPSEAALAWWREQLAAPLPQPELPLDRPRGDRRSFEGRTLAFDFPNGLTEALEKLAGSWSVTMNSLLFTLYGALLARWSGAEERVIGTLSAGRGHPDTGAMVGMFNGFLPIRTSFPRGLALKQAAQDMQERLLSAYEHQEVPFERLLELAGGPFDPARNALFDTMLILHSQLGGEPSVRGERFSLEPVRIGGSRTSKLDLKLDLYGDGPHGLRGELEYASRLLRPSTVQRLADTWIELLQRAAAEPQATLDELLRPTAAELAQLEAWNGTAKAYPAASTLHGLFAEQALRSPDRLAVHSSEGGWTYRELDRISSRMADALRSAGAGRDGIVAIAARRSLAMMAGVMAVLKAGAAYLPLDPDQPRERLADIVDDSGCRLLLAARDADGTPAGPAVVRLELEALVERALADEAAAPGEALPLPAGPQQADPDSLAYVIYTSGSTGRPKGVLVEHRAIVNRLRWMQDAYPLTEDDVILQKTPVTFDVSVWELFWWSLAGASVRLLEPGGEKDPAALLRVIREEGVTTMHFVPSMLGAFLPYAADSGIDKPLAGLKAVFASGEALKPAHAARFAELRGEGRALPLLVNLYGPTEAAVDVSYYDCAGYEGGPLPIGRPIANIGLHVLDDRLRPLPPGASGELCISGVGLARGYLNRPELTAEKFASLPDGTRLYRTGDEARWNADGQLEYLGRFDHQVKLRGQRIECGEIEQAAMAAAGVQDAVAMLVDDPLGEPALCLYVASGLPEAQRTELAARLPGALARRLPDYMLPARVVALPAFPLTPSGKTDRKRLPAPDWTAGADACGRQPETASERKLAELWSALLGASGLTAEANFFRSGGHSLRAAQLAAAVERTFGKRFSLREVFEFPVLEEMAARIDAAPSADGSPSLPSAGERPHYPLTPAQNRLFILHQLDPQSTAYNLPLGLALEGELDEKRLQLALRRLSRRHEALRTRFGWEGGKPVQIIEPDAVIQAETMDGPREEAAARFVRPFDLSRAPLMRAALVRDGQGAALLLDLHHIVSDGVSLNALAADFAALYEGRELAPLPLRLVDAAVWQERWLEEPERQQQEAYWRSRLAGPLPALDLPLSGPRPERPDGRGGHVRLRLPDPLVGAVRRLASALEATPYHVLLAAYAALLHRMTREEDLIVGTPASGRFHPDLEPVVGMFVQTLPLRICAPGEASFGQLVDEARRTSVEALDQGQLPFELLAASLGAGRDPGRNPVFDTMFVWQSMDPPAGEAGGLRLEPFRLEHPASKLDLTFELAERGGGIELTVEYASALMDAEAARRMAGWYATLLDAACADAAGPIRELPLLTAEQEREQELLFHPGRWDRASSPREEATHLDSTAGALPEPATLDAELTRQARLTPEAVAVRSRSGSLTYRELDEASERLAGELRQRGIGRDSLVAVCMERCPELIVAIYGIFKAGAAYVPLAPSLPPERLSYMLDDCGAALVLTASESDPAPAVRELPRLGVAEAVRSRLDRAPQAAGHDGSSLAYVLYTSGSTGRPKGVMIEHRSVLNRLRWMQRAYPLAASDVILHKTPITFDVSVWELMWWSFAGASVFLLEPGGEKDPAAIARAVAEAGVTTMHFVPSMLHLFLEDAAVRAAAEEGSLAPLRTVFASGEALAASHADRFEAIVAGRSGAELVNLYGPTEATVDVSFYNCSREGRRGKSVPIGRPIDRTALYVLSDGLRMQPPGVPGELCIAGVGLARGYLGREELTRQAFVPNPYRDGGRLYRTGDLARWLPDGQLEYLGRLDHQVKLRGYRIECGEIEAALRRDGRIGEAVVLKRSRFGAEAAEYLCAYYTAAAPLDESQLREALARELPDYMIPAAFVRLEAMPLSPSGKTDRRALPDPQPAAPASGPHASARTETERLVASRLSSLLGGGEADAERSFFEAGADSLLLLRLHQQLDQRWPGALQVADLFSYPTVRKLAARIDSAAGHEERVWSWTGIPLPGDAPPAVRSGPREGRLDIELEPSVARALEAMAAERGTGPDSVLLGLFLLAWSQASGASAVSVALAAGAGRIAEAAVDFADVPGMEQLLDAAAAALSAGGGCRPGNVRRQRAPEAGWTAAPLFRAGAAGASLPPEGELLDRFDHQLTVLATAPGEPLRCVWTYAAWSHPAELAAGWAAAYAELLRGAASLYQEAAAGPADSH
ncbi:amino acid adenylation domain-containing protein [Paenibacillus albicereus]|uniref:Amino acid adenylation domain-containing protein n=1 Tax=Paenibacillus albicereus TaxID=2726185 RepID=A0A6H2GVC2_9BACL|nr:non-ribosomal peptide synthetase [Paenibacillus albicereus]QJC51345.1 amino acid adenylation domain-containing protein [Paenibacillus albicereus]